MSAVENNQPDPSESSSASPPPEDVDAGQPGTPDCGLWENIHVACDMTSGCEFKVTDLPWSLSGDFRLLLCSVCSLAADELQNRGHRRIDHVRLGRAVKRTDSLSEVEIADLYEAESPDPESQEELS